jgi:hypothetical protein
VPMNEGGLDDAPAELTVPQSLSSKPASHTHARFVDEASGTDEEEGKKKGTTYNEPVLRCTNNHSARPCLL